MSLRNPDNNLVEEWHRKINNFHLHNRQRISGRRLFDTLDEDTKRYLDYQNAPKRDVVAALLRTAQEKKLLCLQKRWKFKKSNGQEIILRDVMEKIITWLDKFKAIGDIAMQYDTAHASLPWAGVRFLLRVSWFSSKGSI